MPLYDLSGEDAVRNRKSNPSGNWGERNQPNRVEPVALPTFHVPFRLERGERIFTVGSCFARNVETELMKLGFDIPMRALFRRPEFLTVEVGVVNNFGTPSIYNEFAWAFGERPFVPEDHLLEVQTGKFYDLHLVPAIRPDTWEKATARRAAISEAYRTSAECRVIIVTLGLVEVWFDTKTGYYLNVAPLPGSLRKEPDRFRLHVLSFEECLSHLEQTLDILKRHGRPDLKVLLTVSPVPLAATHRMDDVIVANGYSKAVLRSVAETVVAKHDFVTYYPSYESVTLSDRQVAWRDDLVHVTDRIVAINVRRMTDAFVESTATDIDMTAAIDDAETAAETAKKVHKGPREAAQSFFNANAHHAAASVDFALELGQFHIDGRDHAAALAVLEQAPKGTQAEKVALMVADALIATGRPGEAVARLDELASAGSKSSVVWNALLRAALAAGDESFIQGVLARWTKVSPTRMSRPYATVGRWYHDRGKLNQAESYFRTAMGISPTDATPQIYLADMLLACGRRDEARTLVDTIKPEFPHEVILLERLTYLAR